MRRRAVNLLVNPVAGSCWSLTRFCCAVLLGFVAGCEKGYETVRGETMGTYYAVQYAASQCTVAPAAIDALLATINAAMSTYQADSELSAFNASTLTSPQAASDELLTVLQAAHDVYDATGGALDVTVGPLVDLWGFGPALFTGPPSDEAQAAVAQRVGMHLLELSPGTVRKQRPDISVDLSALAKGYAVDRVAALYGAAGCRDFMVDIGGEMRVAGRNPRGTPWQIGIEVPDPAQLGVLRTALTVTGVGIATSGDYRNFQVVDGRRVDHVIDPRRGEPADNAVVSVTVLAPTAMLADAYATALMVTDVDTGLAIADREGLAAYVMYRDPQAPETIRARYNAAMRPYLPPEERASS